MKYRLTDNKKFLLRQWKNFEKWQHGSLNKKCHVPLLVLLCDTDTKLTLPADGSFWIELCVHKTKLSPWNWTGRKSWFIRWILPLSLFVPLSRWRMVLQNLGWFVDLFERGVIFRRTDWLIYSTVNLKVIFIIMTNSMKWKLTKSSSAMSVNYQYI
jgi:hypothetical protein